MLCLPLKPRPLLNANPRKNRIVAIATEDIHPTVVSNLDDDTYMRIDNFYIDNFTGSITANVAIRYY